MRSRRWRAPSSATSQSVSENGRYVAFASIADGLVDGDDDRVGNIYVKDRATGAVTHVNKRTGATGEPANRDCGDAVISDGGTRVAFVCSGPLDDADTNGVDDIYVRDLASNTTILVTRAGNLGPVGDRGARQPSISATGEFVAFASDSTNLHPDAPSPGEIVWRRQIGGNNDIVIVSRRDAANGNTMFNALDPSISDNGNKVAFTSFPTFPDADPLDSNIHSDVFVRDIAASTLALASRAPLAGAVGNDHSDTPALAGNGEAVAFVSKANNLDSSSSNDHDSDVYWRPLTGAVNQQNTARVNENSGGDSGTGTRPSIDDTGNWVGFIETSSARPGRHGLDGRRVRQGPRRQQRSAPGEPRRRRRGRCRQEPGAGRRRKWRCVEGRLRARDGRLAPGVDPRRSQVYLRDLSANPRRTIPVGRPAGDAPFVSEGGSSSSGALSADGRFTAFVSDGAGLGVPDDVERAVVVRDRVTGAITLASRADGPDGAPLQVDSSAPAISADGRRVAFAVPGSGSQRDVWVRDLVENRTFLASRADGADGAAGNGNSRQPSLDGDGSRVSFLSTATNLGDGDTEPVQDAHIRDLETGQTLLVSRADGLTGAKGNALTFSADLSADGFRAAFATNASNLGDGDTDAQSDVHLRDLSAATTRLVSAAAGRHAEQRRGRLGLDRRVRDACRLQQRIDQPGRAAADQPRVFVRDLGADTLVAGQSRRRTRWRAR